MKAELAETGETQKLITDPEARMMHTIKDGYHCCFNVQTAVSGESHLIVDYEVTNHINDQGILHDFTEKIKQNQQKDTLVVVADKGYECKEEIISSIENGIIPYVGFRDDKDTRLYPLEFMPETITEEIRCSTKPADIQKCLHSGVLPACFERTHISVEVKEIGEIGAFSRGEDKEYVTCPMGKQLKRVKDKGPGKVYKCCTACRSCDNRCTASTNPKSVYFGPHTDYVAAYMYGGKQAENLPPENFKPTNSFYKKNLPLKTILLKIKDDPQKQRERLCISEHPFGTVKWYNDGHYVLCKGIQKTTAELGLSFLAYNFKRVINMIGTKAIIEGIRGV